MEKPKTENLTAWITGRNLNIYQKADAVIEYNKLLEYVSDLENQSTSQQQTIERLRNFIQMFIENVDDDMIVLSNADNGEFSETFYKKAEQLLSTTEPIYNENEFVECGVCWGEGYVEINEDTESVECWHCKGKKKIEKNQ